MFGVSAFQKLGSLCIHSRRLVSSKAGLQAAASVVSSSPVDNLPDIQKETSQNVKLKRQRKKESSRGEENDADEGQSVMVLPTRAAKAKVRKEKSEKRFTSASSLPSAAKGIIAFSVSGEPMALARHRSTRGGVMYNPCTAFQKQFLKLAKPFLPESPYMGPLEASLMFHLGRPKSQYYSGKNSHVRRPGTSKWHSTRSGAQNLSSMPLANVLMLSFFPFRLGQLSQVCPWRAKWYRLWWRLASCDIEVFEIVHSIPWRFTSHRCLSKTFDWRRRNYAHYSHQ